MKVPCGVIRDLLPLYAENLAGDESKKLVEEHLSECEPCQQELEKLKGGPSSLWKSCLSKGWRKA